MKYAYIMPNDFVNGKDVSVSVWMQGCSFHCPGCHNPELWDFAGGQEEMDSRFFNKLEKVITANGFTRNLSILGGEPLVPQNLKDTQKILIWYKEHFPNNKIYLWTGYDFNVVMSDEQKAVATIADVIIDGVFVIGRRDVSLELRGSSNQKILRKGVDY